ncbi:MAG: hypothetical protein JNK40_09900 [Chromatiales bacterium]|nr:hypothetical protein [Chromatiales bacterium]
MRQARPWSVSRLLAPPCGVAAVGLVVALAAPFPLLADQEDTQTAVTGTAAPDVIDVSADAAASASVDTQKGEALKATATGVDALAGDDTVTSDAGVSTDASATALLTEQPAKTSAAATATGVSAGDGNDTITSLAFFSSLANALGAYAGSLEYQQPADGTEPPKELDFSITAAATAAGFLTGAGADTVTSASLFTVTAFGTSGGTADLLNATVRKSVTVKFASTAEATATGMESGADDDVVTNSGVMLNTATATAGALAVGLVAPQGSAAPDPQDPGAPPAPKKTQVNAEANAKANAEAVGIDGEEEGTEDSSEDTSPFGLDGLRVTYERTVSAVSGDDTLVNSVFLTNLATATSGAGSAAVSSEVDGTVKSSATSEATAVGAGVAAGGGNDTVTNSGELLSAATATAGALSVSLVTGTPSGPAPAPVTGEAPKAPAPSADKENKAASTTNVTASARATGIDADGEGQVQTTTGSAEISDGALVAAFERTVTSVAGNDVVVNSGAVQALGTATAASRNASVVVSSGGSTDAESKSTATSYGAAIATGAGDDNVQNSGVLTSVATTSASAVSLGLAVGKPQETTPPADGGAETPAATPTKLATSAKTGVEASAEAFGIDAEGRAITTTTTGQLSIGAGGLSLDLGRTETGAAGADTVTNDGVITATATASADSTDAAIGLQAAGSVNSEAEAQAKAASTGIYTGAGDDIITNNVLLAAGATASADSLSIGLTVAKPPEQASAGGTPPDPAPKPDKSTAKVNAGATAEAVATAIDADGARHDKSLGGSLDIGANTLAVELSRSESSLAGDDQVTNRGVLDADAVATSGAVAGGIIVNAAGSVDADAKSRARATSGGILTGAGADTVDNTLLVQSNADATATALALAVTLSQPTDGTGTKPTTLDKLKGLFATTSSVADAEATARAAGIDTEGEAHLRTQTISIGNGGDGRLATYVDDTSSLAGVDAVTNSGNLVVAANSLAGAGAAEIRVQAEGTASATADARANATAGAVLTGGAGDSVTSSGALEATATATAGALAVTFTQDEGPGSKGRSDARATSEAIATGIATDAAIEARRTEASLSLAGGGILLQVSDTTTAGAGADSISNQGQVDAVATATSGAAGVAIAIDGSASSDVDAVARARAGGLDAGGGADLIANEGGVTATATATSGALGIAFGQKGTEKSKNTEKVEASSTAESNATGISGDSGRNTLGEATLAISLDGLSATWLGESEAVAGDDTITSTNSVAATATATSGTVGASIAMDGVAKADIKATATSRAVAIDGGGGNDAVTSDGGLTATATATAGALAAAIGAKTSADSSARTKVDASTVAEAVAAGISADGGSRSEMSTASVDIDGDGLTLGYSKVVNASTGDDAIDNRQAVTTTATASSGTIAAAVSIKGAAHAVADSAATADSRALESGGGADSVINSGNLTAAADATAATLNAAISTEGRAVSNAGLMGAGTSATSRATGISTAGAAGSTSTGITGLIDFNDIGVEARYETVSDGIGADGNDSVINSGTVTVTSDALAPRLDAAITGKGVAVSLGRATADSYGGGIDTGNLDDSIENSGTLDVTATAEAVLANVAVTGKGLAVAANAIWDGGTEAGAVATGINADSGGRTTTVIAAEANAGLARVRYNKDFQAAAGDDTVVNSGAITTRAEAAAPSLNVAVVAGTGLAAAVSTATASADSTAIRGGDGDDGIDNEGVLDATATATAAAANVAVTNQGVAIAADAVWDGGTKAHATATGIAGDGGNRSSSTFLAVGTDEVTFESTSVLADGADTITNRGAITAQSEATALSAGVAVALTGVGVATATSTATARAAAIDAGAGAAVDSVGNSGALTAGAEATAAAASVSVTNSGLALSSDSVWDGGTKADARARGIDVGAGAETVTNDGSVAATATSTTLSAAVAVTISGVAGATATATGNADATAIDASAGNDADTVTNTGDLSATADALAASAAVAVVNTGLAIAADAVWDGGTGARSRARGIDTGEGADTVDNSGAIDATSAATAASLGVSVAVSGVAGAVSTSTATADAAAIDAGADAAVDTVTNSGNLTVNSTATANTATVTITTAGVAVAADAVWDGGTGADATARGISAGLGADTIGNTGDVEVTAEAVTRSAAVSVALSGVAGAISSSTSTSSAIALDAGDGADDDQVTNSGNLIATAIGEAASAAVSFTAAGVAVSGGSVWDGGTRAVTRASGIGLGAGADELVNEGELTADATARATGISVSVAVEGVAGAITAATADAAAAGIDAGAGDDNVRSTRQITSGALANANTVSAAGTKFGVSVAGNGTWAGGTSGTAAASGISGGAGLDTIANSGAIDSTATVVAPSTAVAFTVGGVAASVSTATADADASAIDGGDDRDDIGNTAALNVTADGSAVAVNVALTGIGAGVAADSVWDGGTTSRARAGGIRGGAGNDDIRNTTGGANINATANATATSVAASVTVGGFAGSISTSTAIAEAAAIDAGDGDDLVVNEARLVGKADARGTSVSVSVVGAGGAVAGDSFWEGGTKANATAAGIAGGSGSDDLTNAGDVTADAESHTTSVAIAAGLAPSGGFAPAFAASTSTAAATALEAGAGDDSLTNEGVLTALADADAEGVSVAFQPFGAVIAGAFVDAATRASAVATGMGGADGVDTLTNGEGAAIVLDSGAATRDTAVSLTLAGFSAAEANAISAANAIGLDGGAGGDTLRNLGTITGTVDSRAVARGIAIAGLGAGTAAANATGRADGAGLAGGAGDDLLENSGTVDLTLDARAIGQAISGSLAGASIADASANAIVSAAGQRGDGGADTLTNSGTVRIDAGAATTARSISATALGAALGVANSIATAGAAGLAGGEGGDTITNEAGGEVDVLATAEVTATSVTIVVAGAADGEARAVTSVAATGLAGDAGDDTIGNAGLVTVMGRSRSTAAGGSATVAGSASARAGTEVETNATGIAGGAGADSIVNSGIVRVGPGDGDDPWMSRLATGSLSIGFAGNMDARSAAFARTTSIGLDGGDEADEISNTGAISVAATARSDTGTGALSIFGSSAGGGESGAFTSATGLGGGGGDDLVETLGTLAVTAESLLVQTGTSFTFGGSGSTGAVLEAGTEAYGITGGDGADGITTAGTITVDASSRLSSSGGGDTIFGSSAATGTSGATTRATGIDGGAGDDRIDSAAVMTLTATSDLSLDNASYTFGGTGATGGTLAATTTVDGILGGEGADRIYNSGAIGIDALSTLSTRGGSKTTFGGSSSSSNSGGRAMARGLAGGDGDDVVENRAGGSLDVDATTRVSSSAVAYTFLGGGSKSDAALTGEATATGMAGDAGADTLVNRGEIRVLADAALTARGGAKTSITGTGDPESTGVAAVAADATGMAGGDGADQLETSNLLEVRAVGLAEARNEASTNGFSIVNGNEAGAIARADVAATGLEGGEGANGFHIGGDVAVTARSTAYTLAVSSGAVISLGSDGQSRASSTAAARATGVTAGSGDDVVDTDARLTVTADATTARRLLVDLTVYRDIRSTDEGDQPPAPATFSEPALPAFYDAEGKPLQANRDAYPDGTVVFWTASPPEAQEPNNALDVDGGHYIVNVETVDPDGPEGSNPPVDIWSWEFLADGLIQPVVIEVEVDEFPSYAAANGNGLDGDGNANATGSADAVATGMSLGDGTNTVENRGELIVRAEAEAAMYVSADGDAFGDARGAASATATATATGIALGAGDDTVRNYGEISVTAAPQAQALVNVTGGDVCIWFFGWWCGGGGDGIGRATATLAANATGITAGDGSNVITNDGSIVVVARPEIRNDPRAGQFVADVRQENSQVITINFSSRAVGIETGAGDDVVENNGSISVEAWDGVAGGLVSAAGILTGDGNDIVRNTGSLSALIFQNGVGSAALGIDTGAGNDQLFLGDGSVITGSVSLGDGDDILTLSGTPVIRDAGGALLNADAGAGTDTLVLAGAGSFAGTPLGIERAAKTGPGTYALPSLATVQSLAIEEGTLHLPGSYQFDPDGDFSTRIYADGRNGQLDLDGGAVLAGAIAVERSGARFIADGSRYTLVATGDGVTGSFAAVALPEARPLLSFELEQTASLVDVVANVPSFDSVTANPLYRRVARNLDGLAGRASGGFLDALGSLQSMEGGFDRAFASLSPDANLVTTTSTLAIAQQMTLLLQGHLAASRNLYRKLPDVQAVSGGMSFDFASNGTSSFGFSSTPRLVMTSYLGDATGTWQLAASADPVASLPASRPAARSQAWLVGVAAEGDYDAIEGYSAFDTDTGGFQAGYDLRLGERWIAGLSYGRSDTDVDVDSVDGRGSVDSWSGSVYATWFGDGPYLEGGLSWGKQSFDNSRVLVVGEVEGVATSAHDGDTWSAFLSGGVDFALDAWSVEPYVSLYYYHLEEDAFEESGAGSLNQVVAARSTDALRGELGGRLSRLQRLGGSVLDWHASLALNYDFGIDDTTISYTYAGAPGSPFTLDDRDLAPSSTVLGAGVAWRGDRAQLSLDYRGQYNGDYDEQYYGARLSIRF